MLRFATRDTSYLFIYLTSCLYKITLKTLLHCETCDTFINLLGSLILVLRFATRDTSVTYI
jgi:hypothetical protein